MAVLFHLRHGSLAPIFGKAKMTLMAPATSHPDFPTLNDYMVSGQATMEWEQENFAKFVYNDLGLRKVAHLYQNSDSTLTTDKFFTQFFEELGGEVIAHEMFIPGQTQDFSTFLSKIKEAEPELLYIGAAYSDCANIVKQAHNLDINIPMMANASNMKEEFLDIGGDDVEGFLFVSSLDPSYQGEKFVQFKKNFEEKVASVVDPQSLQMYDLANMFCTALKEYGPAQRKNNEYMRNVQGYEGVNATINMVNGSPKKPMGPVTIKMVNL